MTYQNSINNVIVSICCDKNLNNCTSTVSLCCSFNSSGT